MNIPPILLIALLFATPVCAASYDDVPEEAAYGACGRGKITYTIIGSHQHKLEPVRKAVEGTPLEEYYKFAFWEAVHVDRTCREYVESAFDTVTLLP